MPATYPRRVPEGHTVHRVALQLAADVVGHRVRVTSPQGRFAAGAALLDGRVVTTARAHGKHLFVGFADEPPALAPGTATAPAVPAPHALPASAPGPWTSDADLWLRVHLGLYGAWDLHGRVSRITAASEAVGSMGAPRLRRAVRMGEGERILDGATGGQVDPGPPDAPGWEAPEPVGQVRVRIATGHGLADLRGPAACEVLTPAEVDAVLAAAGPDPRTAGPDAEDVVVQRLRRRRVAVGQLLMDQSVVSGIGNIYRAELLFRARLDPWTPGSRVPEEVARGLWRDWAALLEDGVRTGVMITREGLDDEGRRRALADRSERNAVYGRAGEPCLVCGTPVGLTDMAGRKLYWCPTCQV